MYSKRPSSYRPPRQSEKKVSTRSGKTLKVNRSMGERWKGMKQSKSRRKAERMAGLPKSRFKRTLWRLHPKRIAAYWFSRDGAIMALKITGIAIIVFFVLSMGVLAYFRKDLPDITDISGSSLGGSISYYDKTGKVLLFQDYNAVKRVPVEGSEMSKYLRDATVAVEDRDFYNHRGFDLRGISRAAYNDILSRSSSQGGSTITQQLVKLTQDWTEERTFTRKAKELILAIELERSYTKDEILTGYLNSAPYGDVIYGAQSAASEYFRKSAKNLTLDEAALLASIPKSPSIYSPYNKEYFEKEATVGRYMYVLDSMVQTGKITKEEAEKAKQVDVLAKVKPLQTKYANIKSPYFVLSAKKQLNSEIAPVDGPGATKIGGWKVITSLDVKLQEEADKQVKNGLAQVRRQGGDTAAMVVEDVKTGQVVAVVGGANFYSTDPNDGHEINFSQQPLPPGSSFKPYDYAALIESSENAGAGSVLYDTQGPLPGYPCTQKGRTGNCLNNYDFRQPGPLTLRYALGGSRNIPAVKAFLTAGVDKTVNLATEMGLKSGYKCYADEALEKTTPCYGAAGIGDGAFLHLDEHVHSFSTFSRLGTYIPQTFILDTRDSNDQVKWKWQQATKEPEKKQAIREDTAFIINDILSDPRASYFPGQNFHRHNGWNFALKTGTTNDAKDGWLMGYSTKYAVGVWVGHHTRRVEMRGFMENMTRPIWFGMMTAAHANQKPENWQKPSGVQTLPAFVVTSHVGVGSVEPSPAKDLYPSWYKPRSSTSQNATIDKVSNKLANSCTPALAKENVTGSRNAEQYSVDIFHGRGGTANRANTTASDDVHSCGDNKPKVTLTVSGSGGSSACDSSCTLTATVSAGTHPFNDPNRSQFPGTVNFTVNGKNVGSKKVSDPVDTVSITYNPTFSGSGTVSAQVIDSVLYDATSSKTINFTKGGGSITLSVNHLGGNSYQFNWNTISGASSYEICIDTNSTPDFDCDPGSPGTVKAVPGSNKKAYIISNTGIQSSIASF